MKFAYHGFFAKNMSWSVVAQNISRSLIKLNHSVDVFSTNGIDHLPEDLKPNVLGYVNELSREVNGKILPNNYDSTISYTALKNASKYMQHSPGNRFLIYCYEFGGKNSLPPGFAKAHEYTDYILPPSEFAKQVFIDSGVPDKKLQVIPHGVNLEEIDAAVPYKLKTKKSIKILMNLGQIHRRKNIQNSLAMFGYAFNRCDDICLVLKVQERRPTQCFELSFQEVFKEFRERFPNHAEVEVVREFIPNIYSLYKSCDITFSPSNTEGFGCVPLEGLACGLIPIASNYGGFLEFLDDDNSLLISGKEVNAPPNYLYYQNKNGTKMFQPDISNGTDILKAVVNDFKSIKSKAIINSSLIRDKYSWQEVTKKIVRLTNE